MIELHAHILPGLDDGARDLKDALDLARAFVAEGTSRVYATPHGFSTVYHVEAKRVLSTVEDFRARLCEYGIMLDVRPGMEVHYHRGLLDNLQKGFSLGYGGGDGPKYMLLEFPSREWPRDIGELLYELRLRGVTPILAHPERHLPTLRHPELLDEALAEGALAQVTAGSVLGQFGAQCEKACRRWLAMGRVHVVASDAHDATVRKPDLARALDRIRREWDMDDAADACERTALEVWESS